MIAYIARRLLFMVPTLFGILLINFGIVQFAPGGPVERILAQLQGVDTGATAHFGGGGEVGNAGGADMSSKYRAPRGSIRNSSPNSKSNSVSTSRPMSVLS